MGKKQNPRRVPVSMADLGRAKEQARDEAIELTWAIFFTYLRDKEGYTQDDLQRVWNGVLELSDSIAKGYCTLADLKNILKQEAGADMK